MIFKNGDVVLVAGSGRDQRRFLVSSVFLMLQLGVETWLRFGVWLLIGLVIYFTYGRRHSLLNPDSPHHRRQRTLPS